MLADAVAHREAGARALAALDVRRRRARRRRRGARRRSPIGRPTTRSTRRLRDALVRARRHRVGAAGAGRGDRRRPRTARTDPGPPPATPRPVPQVRRRSRRGDGVPRLGRNSDSPSSQHFDQRAAELDREREPRGRTSNATPPGWSASGAARLHRVSPQAVEARLRELAMGHAAVAVEVGESPDDHPGDRVQFLLAANPGAPLLPLSRVASGGELARAMLALRLVLTGAGDAGPIGERWCSTRSTPGSAARPRSPWGRRSPRSGPTTRCSSSRICRRSRRWRGLRSS